MSEDRDPQPSESAAGRRGTAGDGEGRSQFGERLARIEAKMEHVATKEDIQQLKVWVLGGVLGALGLAVVAATGVAKLFN